MDRENGNGHGAGTKIYGCGFQNERVHRSGGQEQEEHRRRQKRHGPKRRACEERAKREWHGGQHRESQHPRVARGIALLPRGRCESPDQRAHESGDHEYRAEKFGCLVHSHAVSAMQERRAPMPERTQRECVGRVAQHHEHVFRDAKKIHDVADGRSFCRLGRLALGLAAFEFGKRQHHQREEQPRRARPDEGMPPAPVLGDESANDRAQRSADWNRDVENRQRVVPFRRAIAVGNQTRTDGRIARLANADEDAKRDHHRKRRREPRQDCAHTPYTNAGGDEPFARAAVAQPAKDRRGEEVADHERRHEPPGLTVVDVEIFLQRRQHRGEHEAVEVIEQVEAGEDEQHPGRRKLLARGGDCHRLQS